MANFTDLVRAARAIPARRLARGLARSPLTMRAEAQLSQLPRVELSELAGEVSFTAEVASAQSRHAWSLGAAEQIVLQALVVGRGVQSAFEVGTFNGGTTRLLAEALPADGRVVTLDLPPRVFDQTQSPEAFQGSDVGFAYASSPAVGKITQLLDDSLSFDSTPYLASFDLVLVDGGHEYRHGLADTVTALRIVKPGGLILWDDFEPHWHGLVRGICEAMEGRRLVRLAGTSLGAYSASDC